MTDSGAGERGFGGGPQRRPATAAEAEALYDAVARELAQPRTPVCTYRLQLTADLGFARAEALLPYLQRLGITHLYLSPVLAATPGSQHGYDVVDHGRLNPELGDEDAFASLCAALRARGMGAVLDVVPNHMGIEQGNALWADVLENGPASRFARVFDIDWRPVKPELADKVLLPILGDRYGDVLERGELRLGHADGAFHVHYFERTLPLSLEAYGELLGLGLEELREALGPESPALQELASILTSLEHLPPARFGLAAEDVEVRAREKEVIKRRLRDLVAGEPALAAHVERALTLANGTVGTPESFDLLERLLARCCYRLAHWRVAGEEINYRRFFDINGLAAIRVEDPEVFELAHARIFEWLREGRIQGLRIDHPDGLLEPTAYFLRLQERYFLERARARVEDPGVFAELEPLLAERWRREVGERRDSPLRRALYVVVEKIQGGRERIPGGWAVHGTTGYRFANVAAGLFVDPAAEASFTRTYAHFIGTRLDFQELVLSRKRLIMGGSMAAELNTLAHRLAELCEQRRHTRDFTLDALRRALTEFVARFPVYRSYVEGEADRLYRRDVRYIRWTVARAKAADLTTNASIYDFLQDLLLRRHPPQLDAEAREAMLRFTMRLQQLTGPVMAKGVEDTAFYIYLRLSSLNEVGGEPERFGTSLQTFHLRNRDRVGRWGASLLATSTHDTKRSEDVRTRLHVLSELPEVWSREVRRMRRLCERFTTRQRGGPAPSANDQYLFFQTALGAWPMGLSARDADFPAFAERLTAYLLKAAREAKEHTSWTNPDAAYDAALEHFCRRALDRGTGRAFLAALEPLVRRCERPGQLNALSLLLLKVASPGVSDTYQGCELWDGSLVDPDNRRPVDFELRQALLERLEAQAAHDRPGLWRRLWAAPDDGALKLYVTAQGLQLRVRREALFRAGGYRALTVEGTGARHLVAFARHGEGRVLALAPRFSRTLLEARGGWQTVIADTRVVLTPEDAGRWREVFSGRVLEIGADGEGQIRLPLPEAWRDVPLALLERD